MSMLDSPSVFNPRMSYSTLLFSSISLHNAVGGSDQRELERQISEHALRAKEIIMTHCTALFCTTNIDSDLLCHYRPLLSRSPPVLLLFLSPSPSLLLILHLSLLSSWFHCLLPSFCLSLHLFYYSYWDDPAQYFLYTGFHTFNTTTSISNHFSLLSLMYDL